MSSFKTFALHPYQLIVQHKLTNITYLNSIPFLEVKTYTVQQKDKMTNKNKNCIRYINTTQLIVQHKLLLSFFIIIIFWINIGISNREIYSRRNSHHLLPVSKSMKKNRADGDIPHKVKKQSLNYGPQNWLPHISATSHFSKEDTNTNASTVIISIDRCGWDTYVEI